jgi:hypothetical protein
LIGGVDFGGGFRLVDINAPPTPIQHDGIARIPLSEKPDRFFVEPMPERQQ